MFGTRFGQTKFAFTDRVTRTVNGDFLTFSGKSTGGRPFAITVQHSDANEWINGGLIQQCFPYLNADEREILMTGIDSESWNKMFPPEDEE
jgi:hypothetical protein